MRLLIIDDDVELCSLLAEFLRREGYSVECVNEGRHGLELALEGGFDLVILDVMLPGMDGFEILKRLRAQSRMPVLMLTARGEDIDRIVGLEMGADDYLAKPFNSRELLARIRAVLRRAGGTPADARNGSHRMLEFGGWRLDVTGRKLFSPAGALVPLRAAEFDLLLALAERPQRVLTRDQLLDLARGRGRQQLRSQRRCADQPAASQAQHRPGRNGIHQDGAWRRLRICCKRRGGWHGNVPCVLTALRRGSPPRLCLRSC